MTPSTLQYMGRQADIRTLNDYGGVKGNTIDNLTTFNKVTDPTSPTQRAFMFQVAQRDALTFSGTAKRSELSWDPSTHGYDLGVVYWTAFRVRLDDNIKNARSDDEVLFWQIHENTGEIGLNPAIALYASGGGAYSKIFADVRYSSNRVPSLRTNMVSRRVYEGGYSSNTWTTFVVQFRLHHTDGRGAFLKIWRDGNLIVNDTRPNDFAGGQETNPARRSYQKLGVYHYNEDKWAPGDSRTLFHKGIVTYKDNGSITEQFMRNKIESF